VPGDTVPLSNAPSNAIDPDANLEC
jgi:hypothetical protein